MTGSIFIHPFLIRFSKNTHTAEMAKALISANKQYDNYFYPNRNHGIYGDNARLHLYTKMTDFLDENLGTPAEKIIHWPGSYHTFNCHFKH